MKKTFIAAVAALSLTGMTVAIAGPQSLEDAAKAGTVQISKTSQYRLGTGEFNDYAATYKLQNGNTVRFSQQANRYFIQLKGEQRTELHPVAAAKFVTAQGVDVEFREEGDLVAIGNIHQLPSSVAMAPVEGSVVARR